MRNKKRGREGRRRDVSEGKKFKICGGEGEEEGEAYGRRERGR